METIGQRLTDGQLELFDTGAVRDSTKGKPRYDLISPIALRRWAYLMALGAEKYGERNWEKGMPIPRLLESGMRHLFSWTLGDRSEDHLAAVLFNIGGIIHMEEQNATV